jgi:glutathione S-transferase-like protein
LAAATRTEEFTMAIKLRRCRNMWVKIDGHPCWKVQRALDESGIEYEVVPGPVRRGKRRDLERLSGQRLYPVIEFEDRRVYREQSKDMAARIRSGKLFDAPPVTDQPPGT